MTAELGVDDLRSRTVSLEHTVGSYGHKIDDHGTRIAALETRLNSKDVTDAKDGIILDNLTKNVDKIQAGVSKIFWTIILAIIMAFLAFVIQGGLAKARDVTEAFMNPRTQLASEKDCPSQKPVMVRAYCRAEPYSKVFALR